MPVQIVTPLLWPSDLPHTPRARQSTLHGFPASMTIEDAIRYIDDETAQFNPLDVAITTHIEQFASPRLRKLENISSAISVQMKMEDAVYLFPCDRWLQPQFNIYAIVMTLRQIRALDGYGVLNGTALMQNFEQKTAAQKAAATAAAAAPVSDSGALEAWRLLLGLGPSATLQDANAVYRARARLVGENDPQALAQLNDAIDQARHYLQD